MFRTAKYFPTSVVNHSAFFDDSDGPYEFF
jgi:hypothetical protein